jgi:hypothetical protein
VPRPAHARGWLAPASLGGRCRDCGIGARLGHEFCRTLSWVRARSGGEKPTAGSFEQRGVKQIWVRHRYRSAEEFRPFSTFRKSAKAPATGSSSLSRVKSTRRHINIRLLTSTSNFSSRALERRRCTGFAVALRSDSYFHSVAFCRVRIGNSVIAGRVVAAGVVRNRERRACLIQSRLWQQRQSWASP